MDGRKGIDSLAQLCQERLLTTFLGVVVCFSESAREPRFAYLVYDGQGFWLAPEAVIQGAFSLVAGKPEYARGGAGVWPAHQLQVLLAAGDPTAPRRRRRGGR